MCFSVPISANANQENKYALYQKVNMKLPRETDLQTYNERNSSITIYDTENAAVFSARATSGLRYSWNYNTYPYDFSKQTWTSNKNIYDTYPSTNEEKYLNPKKTYILSNPTNQAAYKNAIREGYIRETDELQLYDYTSSGVNNNVMIMLDSNVGYAIVEKETLVSIFASESGNLIGGTKESKVIGGKKKTVINLQLHEGNYLIMFSAVDVTSNNHYALYTGCPLPILNTSMHAGTHNGVAKWNGGGIKAQKQVICPSVGITVPEGVDPGLFALCRIWFEDRSMGGAQDMYVDGVDYYYKTPANSSYRLLDRESGKHGNLYDNTPTYSSIQGNYATKFVVDWSSNVSYANAAFYSNTIMHLEYLTPYGLYAGM